MKITILDGFTVNPGDLDWSPLGEFGELSIYDRTAVNDEQEIIKRIGDSEIVLTNKTPISKKVLDACPTIKFIGVLATGYNVVDYKYARLKDVLVANVPAYGTAAVGQFAIALLLEICHRIGYHSDAVDQGRWSSSPDFCFWDFPLIELENKTMGIIGFGRIGQRTGRIANALGMNIIAYDKTQTYELGYSVSYVDLDQLFSLSDVIVLHCPLFDDTKELINKESIAKMKDGVIIINNSRGELIVEEDLAQALNCDKVYAAGLDVVATEPILPNNPLLKAKNCIITPHISWASKESRKRIIDTTLKNIMMFTEGKPQNIVN